jgi:hypothetical protein
MIREYPPVPLKRYVVPVTVIAGKKVNELIPGGTTTLAIYEEVTNPQGFIENVSIGFSYGWESLSKDPLKFLGELAS